MKDVDKYSPEALMRLSIAVAIAEQMEKNGLLSLRDKRLVVSALNKRAGFGSDSIFTK